MTSGKTIMRKLRDAKGKFRLNRKAVSPVIATLLMIAIAVAAAILVYVWSMGLIGGLTGGGGQQVKEQLMMDAYAWPTTGLTMYMRNVGSTDITIAAIYVQGVVASTGLSITVPVQALSQVTVGSVSGITLTSGVSYTLKIVTITGAVFTFACIYGHGA